jgi:EmrB/QacA subfamily drug resistance transporter
MSSAASIPSPAVDRRRWMALVVVCLAQLMNVLDTTIVNVALPKIQHDLHFTQASLAWVLDAYLISFGSFLLLAGRLGDLIGRKRVFLVGVVIFTAASAVCGLAGDQTLLIVARFIQGLGGALSTSVVLAIIATEFRAPEDRAKAMSAYMFVVVGGGSIGLVAGGAITQLLSWHWNFYINLPIGVAAFLLGSALIDENKGLGIREGIDVLGSILVTAGLMVGVYAIVKSPEYGWTSAHTLGYGGAAIALLASFLALEARLKKPIMPLRILRVRSLIGSSVVRGFLITGMYSTFFMGALYLERVRGYSALRTGLAFLPMTIVVAALSLGATARLANRFGAKRLLVGGLLLVVVSLLLLVGTTTTTAYVPLIFFAYVILGVGAGVSMMPLLTMALADVPPADAGLASGIVNVSLQLAGALGIAVLGTIATDHTKTLLAHGHSMPSALTSGYHLAYLIGAICVAVGIVVAVTVLRAPGRPRPERAPEQQRASKAELEVA